MSLIVDLFFKPQKEGKEEYWWRAIGYICLLLGVGIGIFFLFETLIPLMGYVESGASISALLVLMGSTLLLLYRRKPPVSQTISLSHIQDIFKGLNMESELKNNAVKVVLLAFGMGIALSQLTNVKKVSEFYKALK